MLKGWKPIAELREVQNNYSGSYYSCDYATNNKNMKDMYAAVGVSTVAIAENVIIKRDPLHGIVYKIKGRDFDKKYKREFKTQFGTFYSDDQGEFGGELVTPSGDKLGGNYKYIFDLKDKVYAISSSSHMTIAHTTIYEFTSASEYTCIYNVGDFMAYILNEGVVENFECQAIDIYEDRAYLLLSGYVKEQKPGGEYWGEFRVLSIADGEIKTVCNYEAMLVKPQRILIDGDNIFISMDKMLLRVDMNNNEIRYFTCLSDEDIEDINRVESKGE